MTTRDETADAEIQAILQIRNIALLIDAHTAATTGDLDHFTAAELIDLDWAGVEIRRFDPDADPEAGLDLAESIRERIEEYPLAVLVRTDWHEVGAEDSGPTHYQLLLSTGGPATRIVGELSEHGEAITADIEHQDWGTPWTRYGITAEVEGSLVSFAQCFHFGD